MYNGVFEKCRRHEALKKSLASFTNMLSVKLVTFDVTGTILFFRMPITSKYMEIASRFGIEADSSVLNENFKKAWKILNDKHPNFGKDSGLIWQKWWTECVKLTFNGLISPNDRYKITHISEELLRFYATKDAFTIRPGTHDLLTFLKNKGITLGVVSNYDERLNKILKSTGLAKYFDFVLISYEFGYAKPNRLIFEKALKLANCNSRHSAVHVGDSHELDYNGAKNAGMRALLINENFKDLEEYGVDRKEVFKDFFDLLKYFQTLL